MLRLLSAAGPPGHAARLTLQHKNANAGRGECGVLVPAAVHQRDGATATVEVSSCVPVVNDILYVNNTRRNSFRVCQCLQESGRF